MVHVGLLQNIELLKIVEKITVLDAGDAVQDKVLLFKVVRQYMR